MRKKLGRRVENAFPGSTTCERLAVGFHSSALFQPAERASGSEGVIKDRPTWTVFQTGRAVGIENNNVRNFKNLRGLTGNVKSFKRNDEACKGILIAPSKLPRFSRFYEIPLSWFF